MSFADLIVTYKTRIIVGSSRRLHVAQSNTLDVRKQASFTDQPVCVGGVLVLNLLLDHDAEDIGDVLVQSPGLSLVVQGACVFRDGMSHLVANDIDALGEVVEEVVAISEDHLHLLGIPD